MSEYRVIGAVNRTGVTVKADLAADEHFPDGFQAPVACGTFPVAAAAARIGEERLWRIGRFDPCDRYMVGRLKGKPVNQKATNIAPADIVRNGRCPLVGPCVLMFQRGDELMGFARHAAEDIRREWLA